ncbi:MAG: type II secretion system protein [Terriglobales bacterium]
MTGSACRSDRGFTMIEMMVVITILLIMLGMAMPLYSHAITEQKEENLRQNLETLNNMIYEYAQDKQKAPQSLQDLVTAGYMPSIPEDITGSVDTWVPEESDDTIMTLEQKDTGGVIGVHSGSDQIGSDGTPYSKW